MIVILSDFLSRFQGHDITYWMIGPFGSTFIILYLLWRWRAFKKRALNHNPDKPRISNEELSEFTIINVLWTLLIIGFLFGICIPMTFYMFFPEGFEGRYTI